MGPVDYISRRVGGAPRRTYLRRDMTHRLAMSQCQTLITPLDMSGVDLSVVIMLNVQRLGKEKSNIQGKNLNRSRQNLSAGDSSSGKRKYHQLE